jgi:hypothetical protein
MTLNAPAPLLTDRVLVLAKIETTYNTDPTPVAATNALLVSSPDISVNPNVLERNNARASLSPVQISLGRKLVQATFTHELKGSGTVGVAPAIGPLLRACGLAQTTIANSASATITTPTAGTANAGATITWAKTTAGAKTGRYRVQVVKGGASATAKLRVSGTPASVDETILPNETFSGRVEVAGGAVGTMTVTQGLTNASDYSSITYTVAGSFTVGDILIAVIGGKEFRHTVVSGNTDADGAATALAAVIDADARLAASSSSAVITVTFTSGAVATATTSGTTAITLGASSAQITPTWSSTLTLGDYWDILLLEPGIHYTPISTGFESVTIYMYMDGILHKVTGCMGTVVFNGEAGNFGTAQFTFTGQYIAPIDMSLPTGAVFESTIPQQIELAELGLQGSDDLCAQSFSIDMQNQITPRDCINASDGFNGVRLTTRSPQGTVNPETTLAVNFDAWAKMSASTAMSFHVKVGTTAGNKVRFISDSAQISGITYGDRNKLRVYQASLRFSQYSGDGDDEIRVVFS